MKTVNEVSRLTGVSIRTLQYYDKIGLLHPAGYTEAGYRLYDDTDLERMQQILLFKELEFPLKDIARIIKSPDFDREKAIRQQIKLLTLKKEHLEKLIDLARGIKITGGNEIMDFSAFDTKQLDEYTANAHCSMRSRAAVCRLVIENYELEEVTGELVDPAIAKPNIANLRAAHEAGQHAAQLRRNEYSR